MKKGLIVVLVVVVLAAGAVALVMRNNNKSNTNTTSGTNTNTSTNNGNNTNQQPVATTSVNIQDMAFSPSAITVKKGSTVTWTNKDSVSHTVTGDTSGNMNSDTLAQGDTYTFTFNDTG